MTRSEYIEQLQTHLSGLSKTDIMDAVLYCNEYFDEAGEDNIPQAILDLGAPSRFAAQLRADAFIKLKEDESNVQNFTPRRSLKNLWMMIGGICALPIAVPLGFALVLVIFSLLLALGCVVFALFIAAIATFAAGGIAIISSVFNFSTNLGDSFVGIGMGFISIGVSILLFILVTSFMKKVIPGMTEMVTRLYEKYRRKGKQA